MSKTLKRIFICLGIVAAIIIVCGAIYCVMLNNAKKAVNQAIDSAFTALKSSEDSSKRDELFGNVNDESELNDSFNSAVVFSKVEYNIVEESIGLKKADVTLDITNKNMQTVISNYITQAFRLAFANAFSNEYSDEQMTSDLNSYLESQINSDSIENVTTRVTFHMVKQDDGWHIDSTNSDEIVNAILPNFVTTINELTNSLNDTTSQGES